MIGINNKDLSIEGPPPNLKVTAIYQRIYREYPFLINIHFNIVNNGRVLDPKKTISDYGIGYQTNNIRVQAEGIPSYVFGSSGVIKKMKISGEWTYEEEMV